MPGEMDIFDPFRQMRRLQRRVLESFPSSEGTESAREPLVDVVDTGAALQLIAELPGVDKEGIELSVEDDSIAIKAESRAEAKEEREKEGYYYHERSYQGFYRRIPLPAEVIAEKASAEFKNGILTVTLPKKHPEEHEGKGFKLQVK